MLDLIIAAPRTGKTQYVVSLIYKHIEDGKKVYTTGLNQTEEQRAKLGNIDFPAPEVWWEHLPHGSVWVIDEAQDVVKQRDKGTAQPEWVKRFAQHGHHDLTIYCITHDPAHVDITVRRLANLTHYMSRPLNMRSALVYTFRGAVSVPSDPWRRQQTLKQAESKKKFKYQKKWQDLYTSASAHDHIKLRVPWKLAIPLLACIVVAGCLWFAWSRLKGQSETAAPGTPNGSIASALIGAQAPSAGAPPSGASAPGQAARGLSVDEYRAQFSPRIAGAPWTAPAYDGFDVQDYPRPFCYITDDACKCVTQQGSKLRMDDTQCRAYVDDGWFDPYRKIASDTPAESRDRATQDDASSPDPASASVRIIDQPQGFSGRSSPPASAGQSPTTQPSSTP